MLGAMTNSVHVVYRLDDDQKKKIVEDGGELPQVREIYVGALDDMKRRGFVECDADGVPVPDPSPVKPTGSAADTKTGG